MTARDPVRELAMEITLSMSNVLESEIDGIAAEWEARLRSLLAHQGQALDAALTEAARLRGALEEVERATFSGIPGGRCEFCSARTQDIDPYDPPRVLPKPDSHEEHCPFSALQDRPPLARAAAEILEAAVEVADAEDRRMEADGGPHEESTEAIIRHVDARERRKEAVDRYLALRRGEGEEG